MRKIFWIKGNPEGKFKVFVTPPVNINTYLLFLQKFTPKSGNNMYSFADHLNMKHYSYLQSLLIPFFRKCMKYYLYVGVNRKNIHHDTENDLRLLLVSFSIFPLTFRTLITVILKFKEHYIYKLDHI